MKNYKNKHKFYINFILINYLKKTKLFFFIYNNKKNNTENLNFYKFKMLNSQIKKILKNSIKKNIISLINNSNIFIQFQLKNKKTLKIIKIVGFLSSIFALSLNNKIYLINSFNTISSFNYVRNKKLIYKILISKLKQLSK